MYILSRLFFESKLRLEYWQEVLQKKRQEVMDWRKVAARYRKILFEDGKTEQEENGGRNPAAGERKRAGFTKEQVEEVLARGGTLSEGEMLARRVRYFADGLMIGTKDFVDYAYRLSREQFGPKRQSGARKMRGVESGLHTARDLRVNALG